MKIALLVACAAALFLAGCAERPHHHFGEEPPRPEWRPQRNILLQYDANHDGTVTRAEMEAGLKADFDKIDINHNGCLSDDEVRAENDRRWKADASTYSPLIDWKHKGCIDFKEFAATARSLFDELDLNSDGKLTPQELNPRKRPSGQGGGERRGEGGESGEGDGQ
jgi:hypothetical protein